MASFEPVVSVPEDPVKLAQNKKLEQQHLDDEEDSFNPTFFQRYWFAVYLVVVFFAFSNITLPYAVFPAHAAAKHNLSPGDIGIVVGLHPFATVFFSAWIGSSVLPRTGIIPVIYISIVLEALFVALFGLADYVDNDWAFLLLCCGLRIGQGLAWAGESVAFTSLAGLVYRENVTTMLGFVEVSTGIGTLLGPLIGGALYLALDNYSLPYVVNGLLMVPFILILVVYWREFIELVQHYGGDHAAIAGGWDSDSTGGEPRESPLPFTAWELLFHPLALASLIGVAIGEVATNFAAPILDLHLASEPNAPVHSPRQMLKHTVKVKNGMHGSETEIWVGVILGAGAVAYGLGSPVVGYLAQDQFLGPRTTMFLGSVLMTTMLFVMGGLPFIIPSLATSVTFLAIVYGFVILGVAAALLPAFQIVVDGGHEMMEEHNAGQAQASRQVAEAAGAVAVDIHTPLLAKTNGVEASDAAMVEFMKDKLMPNDGMTTFLDESGQITLVPTTQVANGEPHHFEYESLASGARNAVSKTEKEEREAEKAIETELNEYASGLTNAAFPFGECLSTMTSGYVYGVTGFRWMIVMYGLGCLAYVIILGSVFRWKRVRKSP